MDTERHADDGFPTSPGTLARLIRESDWASSRLGPVSGWPRALRFTVELILRSQLPMAIMWGPDGVLLYNDAYALVAGNRHPSALGLPVAEAWPEVAGFNAEVIRSVRAQGAVAFRDQRLTLSRRREPEDVWLDLDYSAVPGDTGAIEGVLAIVVESTARAKAEAALHHAREQVQLAQDSGAIRGTWLWHAASDRSGGDERFARSFGLDPARVAAGVPFSELTAAIHPDDRERTARIFKQAVAKGTPYRAEYRIPAADGGWAWVESSGRCEYDAAGRAVRFPGVLIDIDERRRSEERLALSEAALRLATDAGGIGTWDLDLTTDTLTWSDRTRAMFGIAPGAPCSMQDFYGGLHPGDADEVSRVFAAALDPAIRGVYDVEYRTIGLDDGVIRWVAAKGRGLFNDAGQCVRAIGTAIDITERKAAEARRAFLMSLADMLRDLSDPDDIAHTVKKALRGHLPAAWVLLTVMPEIKAPRGGFEQRGVDEPARPTPPVGGAMPEVTVRRQGHVVAVLQVAGPLRTPPVFGQSAYPHPSDPGQAEWSAAEIELCQEVAERAWIAVERTRAEARLRDLAASLEQRVEKRTAELQSAEEALRQAQKMEAVGQLTGGIAHDFNNMLSVIVGGLGLAQRRLARGETEVGRFIDAALEGAGRAAQLTQRLLSFARQQPLRPVPLDAGELVVGLTDMLARTLGKHIRLETSSETGLWTISADPLQLENAILNLALNARDAMPNGGRLLIEAYNIPPAAPADFKGQTGTEMAEGDPDNAGEVCNVGISVTDTGTGMTAEVAARAFEPFFTTKDVGRGTGLGLSQVHGFATQSGGDVTISSRPGGGTKISIILPRHGASARPLGVLQDSQPMQAGRAGGVVLVVEDEEKVRHLSVASVRELGFQTLEADGGLAALALLDQHPEVSLVLTDIVMPGMTGRELGEAVRKRRPNLPVLYTSGFTRNEPLAEADLLPKPFNLAQLSSKIQEVFERQPS